MSNRDLKIQISTEADTSGAEAAEDAIKDVKAASQDAEQSWADSSAAAKAKDNEEWLKKTLEDIERRKSNPPPAVEPQDPPLSEESTAQASQLLEILKRMPGPTGEVARNLDRANDISANLSTSFGEIVGKTARWIGLIGLAVGIGKSIQDQLYAWAERINAATAESERLGASFHENGTALLRQVENAKTLGDVQKVAVSIAQERLRIQKEMESASMADREMLTSQLAQLDGINASVSNIFSIEKQREILFEVGRQARIQAGSEQASIAEKIEATERKIAEIRARAIPTEESGKELATMERSLVMLRERRDAQDQATEAAKAAITTQMELARAIQSGNLSTAENIRFNLDYKAVLEATNGDEDLAIKIATQKAMLRRQERQELVSAAQSEAELSKAIADGNKVREEQIRHTQDYQAALRATGGDQSSAKAIADAKAQQRADEDRLKAKKKADEEELKSLQNKLALEREKAQTRQAELKAAGASEKDLAKAKIADAEKLRAIEMEIAKIRGDAAQVAALQSEQRKQDALALAAIESNAKANDPIANTSGGSLIDGTNRRRGSITGDAFESNIDAGQSLLDPFIANRDRAVGERQGKSNLGADPQSSIADAAAPVQEAGENVNETTAAVKEANQSLASGTAELLSEMKGLTSTISSSFSDIRSEIAAIKRASSSS